MTYGDYSLVEVGAGAESAAGFFPPTLDTEGSPVDLEGVLDSLNPSFSKARQDEETFSVYLQIHEDTVYARWMEVYRTFVDTASYDSERVSFTGQGEEHLKYHFSILHFC